MGRHSDLAVSNPTTGIDLSDAAVPPSVPVPGHRDKQLIYRKLSYFSDREARNGASLRIRPMTVAGP
jgi:hypothetical protein